MPNMQTIDTFRKHIRFELGNDKMKCFARDKEGEELLKAIVSGQYKEEIESIRAELKAEAAEKAREKAERQTKIDVIEGLRELTDAYLDLKRYRDEFNAMMDDEYNDGARPPKKPEANIKELRERYPRADACIKAQDWEHASHFMKAAAGRKAMQRIIDGEDYAQAIADMEAEWSAYCMKHMWD